MKGKTTKRIIALVLAMMLTVSALAACSGNGNGSTPSGTESNSGTESTGSKAESSTSEPAGTAGDDAYTISMAIIGNEQPNQAEVHAKVNELLNKELNMNIEFTLLGFGDYADRLNLMLAGGDKLDVLPIFFQYANSYINAGQVVNLADYFDQYGQDIIANMGEDVAKSGAINGYIYGVPANKESASKAGIVMRKDIVDELGIDVSAIKSPWDLTAVFEKVKAAHPEMDMISGSQILYKIETHDPLFDDFGSLMNNGQDTTVTNWYGTEEYKERAYLVNDWYKAGYVKLDAATTTETSQNLVKAGSLFSYISAIKPGFLAQENVSCGMEMTTQYLGNKDGTEVNNLWTNAINFFNWGIAHQSEDKVKAMEFLNFAYSNAEFNNLMNFGIEGEDYALIDGSSSVIDYPEGKDSSNAYHFNMGWMLPNQFLGYVWNGNPEDVWQQYQEFNDSALKSKAFGFAYDSSTVATELAALQSVTDEYVKSIETGSVTDVDATIQAFNDKLYAAGLQKVMDLKQEQLDAWLASK